MTGESVTMVTHSSSRRNLTKGRVAHSRKWKSLRHDQILAAAFDEFAAKGYAEARLDDVADRVGIAKGTIYLYFKNKEMLFQAVLRGLVHHVFEELDQFIRAFPGSAEDLLRAIFSRQYSEVVKNPKARLVFRLLIAEGHKFPQLADVYLREVITPGVAAMRVLVEKGVLSGEFRETTIADFPQVLVGPAVLAIVWALILGERQCLDLDAYMEAHLDLVLCGLRKLRTAPADDSRGFPTQGKEQ
jgi:AcrR family transcriptional regulator